MRKIIMILFCVSAVYCHRRYHDDYKPKQQEPATQKYDDKDDSYEAESFSKQLKLKPNSRHDYDYITEEFYETSNSTKYESTNKKKPNPVLIKEEPPKELFKPIQPNLEILRENIPTNTKIDGNEQILRINPPIPKPTEIIQIHQTLKEKTEKIPPPLIRISVDKVEEKIRHTHIPIVVTTPIQQMVVEKKISTTPKSEVPITKRVVYEPSKPTVSPLSCIIPQDKSYQDEKEDYKH